MKTILINATAARTSGALIILKDFISYCSSKNCNSDAKFLLFTTIDGFASSEKIEVVRLQQMSWLQRIKWDNGGLRKFCENHDINPTLIISMQNTCTNYPSVPQLVYYHQSLPLIPYSWNPLKKEERKLFLYAHFYKYFVNKYNKNATYVVQLPYIKKLFIEKFKNISENNVYVIRPNNPNIEINVYRNEEHKFRFIYPATPLSYKNHKCIVEAINLLKNEKNSLLNEFEVIFTIPNVDNSISELIKKYKLENTIKCIGSVPYKELLLMYKNSEVLLFPSKIETYGLPLVEAASFGLRIIASDLDYAKEVLFFYEDKEFLNPDNYETWACKIEECIEKKELKKEKNIEIEASSNSWEKFMGIVNLCIEKSVQ